MRTVVIEALSARRGGGQTYLRNLFNHYPAEFRDMRVVAILPREFRDRRGFDQRIQIVASGIAGSGLLVRFLWQRWCLPRLLRALRADVLYCPGGSLACSPGPGCKTVVAFRNMLPFSAVHVRAFGVGWMRARLAALKLIQSRSMRKANLVIFISDYAKSVIDRAVPNRRGRSTVIRHGIAENFRERRPSPPFAESTEYVLYVSILNVYKAQLELIDAWAILCRERLTREKLILIGPEYSPYGARVRKRIEQFGLTDQVVLLGSVPHEQLPAYYQHAKINVFASRCENCPNILLEALAAGRAVACSNEPPMPEFAGDAVMYFNPQRPREIAGALHALLKDDALRRDFGERALERSREFQWSASALRTWSELYDLARTY